MDIGGDSMRKYILLIVFFISLSNHAHAGWQDTLSSAFDIVDTFDELADWHGSSYMGDTYNAADMPQLTAGGQSIWDYYSNYTNDFTQNWIGSHGTGNSFSGDKSLALDYLSSDGAHGPSRLGVYIGEGSVSTGYSEIHVFMMLKQTREFYPMSGDDFQYFSYLKIMDIGTGFRAINQWGTVEEQANTDGTVQHNSLYGLNYCVNNFSPVSCNYNLCALFSPRYATIGGSGDTVVDYTVLTSGSRIDEPVLASEWFAVEYRYKLSSPSGASNGEMEVTVYDRYGNELSNANYTGQITLADGTTSLNAHKINKIVLGGNRSAEFSAASIGHFYVDDFIIDDQEIAPTYFSLLAGTPTYNPPTISIDDANIGASSSGTVTGTYYIDPALSAGLCTWSHSSGSVTGFATVLLGVVSGTVTGLPVGTTAVHFSLLDSEGVEATDDPNFIRSAPAVSGVTSTAVSHGVVRY